MMAADWTALAACREIGLEAFFPEWPSESYEADIASARAVCFGCPVRQQCLAEALALEGNKDRHSRDGIWGGLTGRERAALRTAA